MTITVLTTWQTGFQTLGLDWFNNGSGDYLVFSDATNDQVHLFSVASGTVTDTKDLMDTNVSAFGVAGGPNGQMFTTNDWTNSTLYIWSGSIWSLETNPAGSNGRGMEFNVASGNYWEAATSGSTKTIYRFTPGAGSSTYTITQPATQMSGIAVFPYAGNLAVMVGCYNTANFYFYSYNGSALTWIGTAPCPTVSGLSSSLGLCYSPTRDTFFWSWTDASSVAHLTELEINGVSLQSTTWGEIKTLF